MRAALVRIFLASLARRRLASALSLAAIALGVALGLAVQLIHRAALDEFGRGMRLVAGDADLQVLGPREGFDDGLYITLAQQPEVAEASPLLEVEARLAGREETLRVLGIDVFRAAAMRSAVLPEADESPGSRRASLALLEPDALFLSPAARSALGVGVGGRLAVLAGLREVSLRVVGGVPGPGAGQRLGVMDIAAAQQAFDRIGRLSRIDLRLAPGVDRDDARGRLAALLPAGIELLAPEAAESQVANLSRAYRVNLTMLAAIALVTGGFLVFSTQLLSVVRRRQEFAFLRALGLDRRALLRGLLAEGALLGLVGGAVGVALGYALTAAAFAFVGGDLGAGYFEGVRPRLRFEPVATLMYLLLGVAAGVAGAWLPAREAARLIPARALHAGDEAEVLRSRPRWKAASGAVALAALACLLPPVAGVPVFGYAAVALILAGAVMALPGVVRLAMRLPWGRRGFLPPLARARLAAAPGQVVVAGAGVVASAALAVAMAIMVASFRGSVDDWLTAVLPADLYVRASPAAESGFLTPEAVARVAALPGVAEASPVRYDTLRLDDRHFPVTLIARPVAGGARLPLVSGARSDAGASAGRSASVPDERESAPADRGVQPPPGAFSGVPRLGRGAEERAGGDIRPPRAWVSEAMADLFGLRVGDPLVLPLGGSRQRFRVEGIWRDYARQHGAVVVELADYRALTGDPRTNDVALRLEAGADADAVSAHLRELFGARAIEINSPGAIRARSLEIFDRTFLVTYAMEAVAVLIGLFGISTSFAALATARRKEFGMLRHLGVTRGEVGRLLALEGALGAAVGVAVGLVAGGAIAFVLIEVVNRQSFHWSMDLRVPVGGLAAFALALIVLAALAARLAGRQAMRQSAVLAVREDW